MYNCITVTFQEFSTLICCCIFLRVLTSSLLFLLACSSWISISLRSASIFFFSRKASARPLASASRLACRDSIARWWFFLVMSQGKIAQSNVNYFINMQLTGGLFITGKNMLFLTAFCYYPNLCFPFSPISECQSAVNVWGHILACGFFEVCAATFHLFSLYNSPAELCSHYATGWISEVGILYWIAIVSINYAWPNRTPSKPRNDCTKTNGSYCYVFWYLINICRSTKHLAKYENYVRNGKGSLTL